MSSHRVVVDGSNIATEGRSLPSLQQLDEAVKAYSAEHPDAEIIVVVDATFAHRIDDSEKEMFEEAAAHNELVYPPAGAIGRGDAFLLRIADKTDAVVLSNDSFQEFHGEFEWLFSKGRLIGGTPVPGVGWIFVPRTPVRGPKSREAVKEAKRGKARIGSKDAAGPMPVPKAPPPRAPRNKDTKGGDNAKPPKQTRLKEAIDEATDEAVSGDRSADGGGKGRKRRRRKSKGAPVALPTVNEPLTFIQFIADHQPGASVEGEIESFSSHGAFVMVGEARCYIPLSAMGDPPPRSAREIFQRGESRTFVVQSLDAPRRGIELALPGFVHVSGHPTDETIEAEIDEQPASRPGGRTAKSAKKAPANKAAGKKVATKASAKKASAKNATPAKSPAKKVTPAKSPAKKVTPAKKVATKEAPAAKKAAAAKKAPAKKAPAKKAPAPEASATAKPAKNALTAKKSPTAKKAPAKKSPTAKKAPAKKSPTAKKAPAKKSPTTKSATTKAAAAEKPVAKKAPAKKSPAKRAGAAKRPAAAKKAGSAKKAPAKKAPGSGDPAT